MPPPPDTGAGGLSAMLAMSDGRVFGGRVAGLLTAASPVQVHYFTCKHLLDQSNSSLSRFAANTWKLYTR